MHSPELIEAVMVTAEICGRTFSEPAAKMFLADLSPYPEAQVVAALARCRREVRGVLTLHDVVSRLDDGRPGVEEAWAMFPKRESDSAVWTDEARIASGVVFGLMDDGDMIGARMAFKEAYSKGVQQARDAGRPVEWHVTLGHDTKARDSVLAQAVEMGRITLDRAREFVPALQAPAPKMLQLVGGAVRRIA